MSATTSRVRIWRRPAFRPSALTCSGAPSTPRCVILLSSMTCGGRTWKSSDRRAARMLLQSPRCWQRRRLRSCGNSLLYSTATNEDEMILRSCAIAIAAGAITAASPAAAQDFYRGKTITILVGFSPGGGFDINARVLARHIGRHIPGNPTVVVQNMPGAGSLTAVHYLDLSAPKDGTVLDIFNFGNIRSEERR